MDYVAIKCLWQNNRFFNIRRQSCTERHILPDFQRKRLLDPVEQPTAVQLIPQRRNRSHTLNISVDRRCWPLDNRRLNFHLAPMALFPKDFKVSAHDQIRLRGTSFLIHSLIHLRLHVVIRVHKPHIFPVRRLRSYITCYSGSFVFLMEYTKAGIFFRHSEEQLHAAVCRAIIYQNNLDIR